jgi:hypothetical protein
VLINEFSSEGKDSGNDDFVELYNPNDCAIDLEGWRLMYSSSSASPPMALWTAKAGLSLAPKGFLVLGTSGFTGTADEKLSSGLSQSGGGVGLRDASDALVDAVAWGNAVKNHPFLEGTLCKVVPANQSGARKPDGQDTDDNAADFLIPSPRTPGKSNQ